MADVFLGFRDGINTAQFKHAASMLPAKKLDFRFPSGVFPIDS